MTTTLAYDGLNRPTGRSYSDGSTPAVTYCYDGANSGACEGGPVPPGYRKGKLTFVKSAASSFAYNQFDGLGRVTQTAQTVPGVPAVTLDYAYNLAGGLTSERYSLLRTVTTTFDDAGRVSGVAGYASGFSYTASGALQQFTLGSGLVEAAVFNSRMQPTSMTLTNPANGAQLFGLVQEFAASTNNGNVLGQTITAPSLSITQKYGYDSLNRLSVAAENPASGTAICPDAGGSAWCEKYSYDRYGNRWIAPQDSSGLVQLAVTPTSESWFNPHFNPNDQGTWNRAETNRVLGNGYDSAGNQTSAGGAEFGYDAENRQKSVTLLAPQSGTFSYSYDGDSFRVKRSVYGIETVYFHDAFGRVVTEYRNGNWMKDFVYLGGQLLAVEDAQGCVYVTADHLGSTRLVTEADRDVRSRHDYLPFGKEIPPDLGGRAGVLGYMVQGWSPTHRVSEPLLQRFTGQELDPETGLEHFMFRYHSGRQGRFTSADPISGDASDPQSLNGYSYGLNNPLLYVDPLGLSTACYVDGVLSSCSSLSTLINMGAAFLSPLSPSTMIRWNRNTGTLQIYAWAGEYTDTQDRDEKGILLPVYRMKTIQGWKWLDTRVSNTNLWNFLSRMSPQQGPFDVVDFLRRVPIAGSINIPVPSKAGTGGPTIPFAVNVEGATKGCIGLGFWVGTPAERGVGGGPLLFGNLSNSREVLSGASWSANLQVTPFVGGQVIWTASGQFLAGPTAALTPGFAISHSRSTCR